MFNYRQVIKRHNVVVEQLRWRVTTLITTTSPRAYKIILSANHRTLKFWHVKLINFTLHGAFKSLVMNDIPWTFHGSNIL